VAAAIARATSSSFARQLQTLIRMTLRPARVVDLYRIDQQARDPDLVQAGCYVRASQGAQP
jgi:hypothetical protein